LRVSRAQVASDNKPDFKDIITRHASTGPEKENKGYGINVAL